LVSERTTKSHPRLAKTRPDIDAQIPVGRVLNEIYWLQFSENPAPTTRLKMIFVTVDDVSRVGPSTFNAIAVCDALDVSYSLVNFHFGSRDELIAEATAFVYRRYVDQLWLRVQDAEQTPRERLRAWIAGTAALFGQMGGWGVIINYPTSSLQITKLVDERYGQLMLDLAELNLARLMILVSDVKKQATTEVSYELGNLPREAILADAGLLELAASVELSTLGLAVWYSGRRLVGEPAAQAPMLDRAVAEQHIERIINQV
jgi:AcrR family transcriptional regulator